MSKASDFRAKRRRVVTLPDETQVVIRRPDAKRAWLRPMFQASGEPFLDHEGNPVYSELPWAWLKAKQLGKEALIGKDYPEAFGILENTVLTAMSMYRRLVVDAAIEPRVYFTEREAEDRDGLCVWDFTDDDLQAFAGPLAELMEVTATQLEAVAPFPDGADSGADGGTDEHEAEQTAEEAA